ncbi:MAG TPA: recombinase family protein, partial [Bryobacteraceae bacterium]|nr:recombinase family protein [Bryobacteraceae bacterium]
YLEYGSLMPVVQELDRRGWRMKAWTTREGRQVGGKPFAKNSIYNLLKNLIYTGNIEFGGEILPGEHDRIIDDETFDRVQQLLNRNGSNGGREIRNKYGALLKGIVRCASCDTGMVHTYTNKGDRLYRYYVCIKAHQQGWNKCPTRSVSAPALEGAVVEQIRGIARNPAMLGEVMRQIAAQKRGDADGLAQEKEEIERELVTLAKEMSGLAVSAGGTGAAAKTATDRLAELHERNAGLERRLTEIRQQIAAAGGRGIDANHLEKALNDFDPLWQQMTLREQERFIRSLIEQVRYDGATGTVTVGFRSAGIKSLCHHGTAQHS